MARVIESIFPQATVTDDDVNDEVTHVSQVALLPTAHSTEVKGVLYEYRVRVVWTDSDTSGTVAAMSVVGVDREGEVNQKVGFGVPNVTCTQRSNMKGERGDFHQNWSGGGASNATDAALRRIVAELADEVCGF